MNLPCRHPQLRAQHSASGFTLVEMLLTMAIFILLSAAIFEIISGVLHSASALQDNQTHNDKVVALGEFIRKKLGELPAASQVTSYRRGDGEGLNQNGILFGQEEALTALDAKLQPNGYYTLRLTTYTPPEISSLNNGSQHFIDAVTGNDSSLNWSPLIKDVKIISWKFQDPNTNLWVDSWNSGARKPPLVELTIQLAGDLQPAVIDFWIPQLQKPSLTMPPPSTNAP